ncbi:MAG: YfcE family phosphodiesterase [Anaerolineae bacterium]
MRIAIISDIHDNLWTLERVLNQVRGNELLLVLGDLCSPFTLAAIGAGFNGQVHSVWGNNDGDKLLCTRAAEKAGNVQIQGFFGHLELDRRKIAFNHYPEVAIPLAASGQFALVCHGHDHQRKVEQVGGTWLVNPGEVMGRFGVVSYATFDTTTNLAEIHTL